MNETFLTLPESETRAHTLRIAVVLMIAMLGMVLLGSLAENAARHTAPSSGQPNIVLAAHWTAQNSPE